MEFRWKVYRRQGRKRYVTLLQPYCSYALSYTLSMMFSASPVVNESTIEEDVIALANKA